MMNLGGVAIDSRINDAQGLGAIQARIGVIKGIVTNREVEFLEPN